MVARPFESTVMFLNELRSIVKPPSPLPRPYDAYEWPPPRAETLTPALDAHLSALAMSADEDGYRRATGLGWMRWL